MSDLEFQLRNLSKDRFESFVCQFLVAKFPGAGIKGVDGSGGDQGIDSFSGYLASGPAIWQCKHFPDRIRKPQKNKILASLRAALKHDPKVWTLCIPINLRTEEFKWFETEIVAKSGGPNRIRLIQASDFLAELLQNRNLRDAYFPDHAVSQALAVRKLVTGTEALTAKDREALVVEYAQQFLQGDLLDPRLDRVLAIGSTTQHRQPAPVPGLILSTTSGESTISYYARDVMSYQLDPLKFTLTAIGQSQELFNKALLRGEAVTIPAGQLLGFTSASPFLQALFGNVDASKMELKIVPQLPPEVAARVVPLRFMTGQTPDKHLDCVPFRVVRAGQAEVELKSETQLPVEISVVFRFGQSAGAHINLHPKFLGADVKQAQQLIEFLDELTRSRSLRVETAETGLTLLDDPEVSNSLRLDSGFKQVVRDLAAIATVYRKRFRLPADLSEQEISEIHELAQVALGEPFYGVELRAVIHKQTLDEDATLLALSQDSLSVRFEHTHGWRIFKILGERIDPGPVIFEATNAVFERTEAFRDAYRNARNGDAIDVVLEAKGPCRFLKST